MKLSSLKRNAAAAEAGQWVDDIPGMDDVRLRVRGLNSATVVAVRSRKERKVPRDQRERDGQLKADVALRILGETLHEAVLLDWDGFTDDQGAAVQFDSERAKELLTDPDFMAFADAVVYAAQVVDKGQIDAKEEAGNASRASSPARSKATT